MKRAITGTSDSHVKEISSSVSHFSEDSIFLSAEIMKIKGIRVVYVQYQIKKRGEVKDYDERWTPPGWLSRDNLLHTTLTKAAALLNKTGVVRYTFDGLANEIPKPIGRITFEAIDKEDNPTYNTVQNTVRQALMDEYA